MNYLILTLGISFLIQTIFFIFAFSLKTDKVTDLSYGLTFIILSVFAVSLNRNPSSLQITVMIMIIAWAIRLIAYLLVRILRTKKDRRFDGVREKFLSFAQFWFFQALTVWIIMLPSLILFHEKERLSLNPTSYLAILIWLSGLIIEIVSDQQKFIFKNKPENKNNFISSGLWKYSRHPNYFGEILIWIGIFVISAKTFSSWDWLSIISPLFIAFILLFISGIPPLEKKYAERYRKNQKYQEYLRTTSLLIPLPKRK